MNPEITYAVVDIEATGTGLNAGEQMIQFACILYRNGEIIQEFNTLVQPEKTISQYITKLTGISNQDVKSAPYFDELADVITTLLEDTIFVAHNVGFDFRFLNEHLERAGKAVLENKTIDTVELSQVLWPTASSYKLEELAELMDEPFANAHNALADARITVKLLQALWNRAASLPLPTLNQLVRLSGSLAFNTGDFLSDVLKYSSHFSKEFVEIKGLAFKPYEPPFLNNRNAVGYPISEAAKEKLFLHDFQKRTNQWMMMDTLYEHFSAQSKKSIAIEAPAGMGKTLGYLYPLTYFVSEEQPLLVSTQTTLLQNQIKDTVHTQITQLQGRDYLVAIAKSPDHYINIAAFSNWLAGIDEKNSSAYSCMRILVWLTETETGDLEELGRGSQQELELWDIISGYTAGVPDVFWNDVDFLARRQWKMKHADILVTNHAYLSHDWSKNKPTLPIRAITVLDEAHHLPDIINKQTVIQLTKPSLLDVLNHLEKIIEDPTIANRMSEIEQAQASHYLFWQKEAFSLYFDLWKQNLNENLKMSRMWQKVKFHPDQQNLQQKRLYKDILNSFQWLKHLLKDVVERPIESAVSKQLHPLHMQTTFNKLLKKYENELNKFIQLFKTITHEKYHYWVKVKRSQIELTFVFKMSKLDKNHQLIERFLENKQIILTSSSLSGQSSIEYIKKSMGGIDFKFYQIPSNYDYANQSLVLLPEKGITPNSDKKQYARSISRYLEKILKNNSLKVMVLFHSLEMIDEVYQLLVNHGRLSSYQLLAQGKSGSRTRILRRFKNSKSSILLGSDTFSEGLDLPGNQLDIVIIPRLPFDSPDLAIFEIYEQTIEDPSCLFKEIMLPRAVMRFKQIFGRLIRSTNDRGILIVLDKRYLTANYKNIFNEALPKETPQLIQTFKEIRQELKQFFS